jgi:uncharacterized C2H2 Zn-finger protein
MHRASLGKMFGHFVDSTHKPKIFDAGSPALNAPASAPLDPGRIDQAEMCQSNETASVLVPRKRTALDLSLFGVGKMPCAAAFRVDNNFHSTVYRCMLCEIFYRKRRDLIGHINAEHLHFSSRPFSCPICNVTFQEKRSVRSHLLLHENGRFMYQAPCDAVQVPRH